MQNSKLTHQETVTGSNIIKSLKILIYLIVKNADSCTLLLLENNKIHIFSFQFNVSYPRIIEIFARPCFIIVLLIALLSLQHVKFEISNELYIYIYIY